MTSASYMTGRKRYYRPQAMLWSDDPGTLVLKNPSNPALGSIYAPTGYEVYSKTNTTLASGTIGSITGTISWTFNITGVSDTSNIVVGGNVSATDGTGSFGTSGTFTVVAILSSTSFRVNKTGGNSPTAGTISNIVFSLSDSQLEDTFLILSDHNRGEINVSTNRIEQRVRMANGLLRSNHIADKLVLSTSWNMLPSRAYPVRANFNQTTGLSPNYGLYNEEYTVDGGAGGAEMLKWYEEHKGPFWVFLAYDKYTNFGSDDAAHLHLAEYSQIVQMYITDFQYSVVKRGQPPVVSSSPSGPVRSGGYDMWNISVTLEEA